MTEIAYPAQPQRPRFHLRSAETEKRGEKRDSLRVLLSTNLM